MNSKRPIRAQGERKETLIRKNWKSRKSSENSESRKSKKKETAKEKIKHKNTNTPKKNEIKNLLCTPSTYNHNANQNCDIYKTPDKKIFDL